MTAPIKIKTLKPMLTMLTDTRVRMLSDGNAQSQAWRSDKRTSAERGYGHKWRQARAGYLRKHPLCVDCCGELGLSGSTEAVLHECIERGVTLPFAVVVDHIEPHRGDMERFWDRTNWQALCKRHHDIKTGMEIKGGL